MTRFTSLFTTLTLSAALAACGGRPASPSEMPPLAPHPDLTPSAVPVRGAAAGTPIDAGAHMSPGPVTAAELSSMAVPASQPVGNAADAGAAPGSPRDAAGPDSYTPPLPPIPDGGVPVDGRMVPSRD